MTKKLFELVQTKYEREFNIAETMQVLKANFFIFASWGSKNFTNCENKGLLFMVNGNHHRGYVLITLAYNDTYTVYIINNRGRILNTYTEIYFDVLVETIDNRIEKIVAYKY
jgi:hypothetical protein